MYHCGHFSAPVPPAVPWETGPEGRRLHLQLKLHLGWLEHDRSHGPPLDKLGAFVFKRLLLDFGDEKYWQRRNKNNVAAKRSRDARRLKENQITVRAAFLERENAALRSEVAELRKECGRFKAVVTRYQAKYRPL
ncbi:hypothetical protein CRUP_032560 [Coryphaenoides rupestris]|nr:hypothetical protein CRUP_032560 [Coryphaenoides rupestris]